MEPETCTAAQEENSDTDQNVHDPPPTAGEKSDESQQIISEGTINWYKLTLALHYLQPAFVSIVKDEMTILQEQIKMHFGRKLCAEATAKDITSVNKSTARFSHRCTAKPYKCQTLISIILQHTNDCVQSYEMLKGTDPQKWLTSPFEFVRLFLEDWLRCEIHDFPECDITVLCSLVKRCKRLMQMFAPTNIDEVRKVTNRTLRLARLNIDQLEMERNIDVILDFLQHIKALDIKTLNNMDEITKAIDNIKKLRTGDVKLLHGMVLQPIQGWLSSARRQFANKHYVVNDLRQNIVYMENELARLTSGQEAATTIKEVEEPTFQAKIKKLTDENQHLTQKTVDMAKEQEELEKQNEELRKRLQEELEKQNEELRKSRQEELEKQNEELRKSRQEELEKQNEELRKSRETMESRIVGEECRPKAIPTQRSPGDGDGQKHTESINRDKNVVNWIRIAFALKSLQPAIVPIVQKTMTKLHKDSLYIFGRKLCSEANAYDIARSGGTPHVIFRHKCAGFSSSACNSLLNIITKLTATYVDVFDMLRDTDPHTWLDSPFHFTSIFLDKRMRLEVRKFEECDLGALFYLIKRCHPLRRMFNINQENEDVMMPLGEVRRNVLHCSSIKASEQEMEDAIDVMLNMLRQIEHEQVGSEVTEAIEDIEQIKTCEIQLVCHEKMQLLQEVVEDLKGKRIHNEDLTNMLRQNIIKLETALDIPETSNSEKIVVGHQAEDGTVAEINTSKGFLFWCRSALALKYLQRTWISVVEKEMDDLHSETLRKSLGKLCPGAKSEDIARAENGKLKFKHTCKNNCNEILDAIQNLFPDSVDKFAMLQGTDPQTWLSSPSELTRLFMKTGMRSQIKQIGHCDIIALCQITKRCLSLVEKIDENLVIDVRSVRNTTVHSPTMELSHQKMKDTLDVVHTFIRHLKWKVKHLDIAEADENIYMLENLDFSLLRGSKLRQLQDCMSEMRRDVAFKQVETAELSKLENLDFSLLRGSKLRQLQYCMSELRRDVAFKQVEAAELSKRLSKLEKTVSNIISEDKLPGKQFTERDENMEKKRERLEKEEKERKERERLEKEEKERKERKRLEKEEKERKITNLKEEKKTLEKEIEEIEGHIEMLNINLRQFLRGRQVSQSILGGLFGAITGGIVAGPVGAVAGAHAGSKIGSSVAAGTLHVFGTYIAATTEDSCEEGIQRLKHEIHERSQRVTYLDQEIAKQQSDLSQLAHNM